MIDFVRIGWMIGGAQGLGVDTSANVFGNAIARSGYYIFGSREYYSNIKGRHSYFSVIISDRPQMSIDSRVNILSTFDAESVFQHFDEVSDIMIYDTGSIGATISKTMQMEPEIAQRMSSILSSDGLGDSIEDVLKYLKKRKVLCIGIDYGATIKGIINTLKLDPFIAERARNIVCASASFGLLGLEKEFLYKAISTQFKNETMEQLNNLAAGAGFSMVENFYKLSVLPIDGHRIQVDGNTLSAMGKMYAGLGFQSYYPITPASDESTYIETNQMLKMVKTDEKRGVVVLQTEDEIAAINAANGAAITGTRAATATSGPGFSLMNEGISWAGMNEVPILITYYMRGSPATGLPTRSGQSDLKLAINAGHGEFGRIVIASGSHMEIFKDAAIALNLAEICQTPTVHIIEKTLANAYSISDESELVDQQIKIDRGKLIMPSNPDNYKRFELTDDYISPRAAIGHAHMYYTGDEHNEYGHITEETQNRNKMYEKRIKKMEILDKYLDDDFKVHIEGDSDIVLLTWGSPKGAIVDSIDELKARGISVEMVQVRLMSPYPKELLLRILSKKKRIIAVENNYSAQGAQILSEQTGLSATDYIVKYNGRPITKDEIIASVQEIVDGKSKRVVLNAGK